MAALPDHLWLDRLVRGRAWIPLLGILLAGIVAAQVEILKLGATMGRALQQTSTLTAQNEQLRGSVATLGDDQRIERLAGAMGFVLPPPGSVGYLVAGPDGNVGGALGNIHTPDSAAFVNLPAKNGALITGPGTSTLPPSPGAPPPPASTATTSTSTATTATATQTGVSQTTPSSQTSTTPVGTTTPQSTATTPQATTTSTTAATTQQAAPTQQTAATTSTPPTGAAAIQPSSASQTTGGG